MAWVILYIKQCCVMYMVHQSIIIFLFSELIKKYQQKCHGILLLTKLINNKRNNLLVYSYLTFLLLSVGVCARTHYKNRSLLIMKCLILQQKLHVHVHVVLYKCTCCGSVLSLIQFLFSVVLVYGNV